MFYFLVIFGPQPHINSMLVFEKVSVGEAPTGIYFKSGNI